MPEYDPTPDEILERCLEVQQTWDENTRASRKTGIPQRQRPRGWAVPMISTNMFREAILENQEEHSNDFQT
jgi:hypothetical protein